MSNSIPVFIVPFLNREDLLEALLESIDYPIDNILIIDNSGSLNLSNRFNNLNIHLLNMPSNLGVSGSWNLGIKSYPHSKYWLIGSCDNIFTPGSLKKISEVSSKDELLMFAGFGTFSIGSEVVKNIGLFDENYYPAYYEDVDYCSRIEIFNKKIIKDIEVGIKTIESAVTLKSNSYFKERNKITNESNAKYWENQQNLGYPVKKWDLQRRIDNEWIL